VINRGENTTAEDVVISNCVNYGEISSPVGPWGRAGGIVGNAGNSFTYSFCANLGKVTGAQVASGIAVQIDAFAGSPAIRHCYNGGSVTTTIADGGAYGLLGPLCSPVKAAVVDAGVFATADGKTYSTIKTVTGSENIYLYDGDTVKSAVDGSTYSGTAAELAADLNEGLEEPFWGVNSWQGNHVMPLMTIVEPKPTAVALYRNGKYISGYDTIPEALTAYNAMTDAGTYVMTVTGGVETATVYELADQVIMQAANKIFTLKPVDGQKVTLKYANGTYGAILNMYGSSHYTTENVFIEGLGFDLTDAKEGIHLLGEAKSGGDPYSIAHGYGNNARYSSFVTVKDCSFTGGGDTVVAIASPSACSPSGIAVTNCTCTDVGYLVNSYVVSATGVPFGFRVYDCHATNCKVFFNQVGGNGTVEIKNCTAVNHNDYCVRVGKSLTVDGCSFTNTASKGDLVGAFIYLRQSAGALKISNTTFVPLAASPVVHDIANEVATFNMIADGTIDGLNFNNKSISLPGSSTKDQPLYYDFQPVAQIVDTGVNYETVADVFAKVAADQTIKLLVDATYEGELEVGKTCTLDLGGKTLTLDGAIAVSGSTKQLLTIKNGTLDATGSSGGNFRYNLPGGGILYPMKDCSLALDGVTFIAKDLTDTSKVRYTVFIGRGATLTAKDCVFNFENALCGFQLSQTAKVTLTDSTVTFKDMHWAKDASDVYSAFTCQDGKIADTELNIVGSTVKLEGVRHGFTYIDAVKFDNSSVTIDNVELWGSYKCDVTLVNDAKFTVANGSYDFDPTAYKAEGTTVYQDLIQPDSWTVLTEQPTAVRLDSKDRPKNVYATLAAAVAAVNQGDKVVLQADNAEKITVTALTGFTMDTNGHQFTGKVTTPEGYEFKDNGDGTYVYRREPFFEIFAGETSQGIYYTMAAAVAAVKDGETIKVLKSGNVVTDYEKNIGDEGYSETNGANRLVFGVNGAFVLDLNGKELCGRINFTQGDMTVSNGTFRSASQALNIYGSKAYTEQPYTTITLAADATVRANYGLCIFGGDPSNGMWPLGFGETFNVYGKVYAPSPVFVSGNVGMDTYADNIGVKQEIEDIKTAQGKSISQMMLEHGPVINVYEGTELGALFDVSNGENSPQGISMMGCTTVNVYGGKIYGAEAIGVKGGCLNVYGGTLLGKGPKCDPIVAINSSTESSGGAISVSTTYNMNYPIAVNVTGGMIKSANNAALVVAHSYSGSTPKVVVQGISLMVAGGTFIGGTDEDAIAVEESVAGDAAGKWPANFIWPELDGDKKETGYPLCSSKILPRYIAEGYVEKENQNCTWTVTAGSAEIKVVDNDFTAKYDKDETVTDDEAQGAADEVKDDIKKTLKDPSVSDLIGTGVNESTKDGDQLRDDVVEALKAAAPEDQKEQITVDSSTTSFVEIKLDDIKVNVTSTQEEGQPKVIEKTLTAITYEVKPIVTTVTKTGDVETTVKAVIPEGAVLAKPITFRLWLDETFTADAVEVTHKSSMDAEPIDVKTYLVQTDDGKRYIDLTWNRFSFAVLKSTSTGEKGCLANGNLYDTVADAIADSLPTDATITLLKDCGDTGLALGNDRTIALNGYSFTGSLAMDAGKEMVRTKDDTIYVAPEAVKVPTSGTASLPIRGYSLFPSDVTTDEAKKAYLAADDTNGRPRWQNYILGTSVKLVPEIVGAAEGFSTVVIKAATGWTMTTPAKAGVAVRFNLVKKDAGDGAFAQYGSTSDTQHFQVNVNDVGPKTYWKIQTMFESTEAE